MTIAGYPLRENVSGGVRLVILCLFLDLVFVDFLELGALRWRFHIFAGDGGLVALDFS